MKPLEKCMPGQLPGKAADNVTKSDKMSGKITF